MEILCEVYGVTRIPTTTMGGVLNHPENTIILTRETLFVLSIPYQGYNLPRSEKRGNIVSREAIREKAQFFLNEKSLKSLLGFRPTENSALDLSQVSLEMKRNFLLLKKLTVTTPEGKKIKYIIHDKEDYKNLSEALKKLGKL